jgi:hypothetical protein
MRAECYCGNRSTSPDVDERTCVQCGIACCAACAFSLESAVYCVRCAETLLEAAGPPLDLAHVNAATFTHADDARAPSQPAAGGNDSALWLILVARDQADLYNHLVHAFSRDDKVQILLDRRRDHSRNPPGMEERLRIHGAAVIRRRLV